MSNRTPEIPVKLDTRSVDALLKKLAKTLSLKLKVDLDGKNPIDVINQSLKSLKPLAQVLDLPVNSSEILQKMANSILEVDTAMSNLQQVTGKTSVQYEDFLARAGNAAISLGRDMTNYINQTTDWAKRGFSIDSSAKLAETSSIYSNISGIDDQTAITDLSEAMEAFNITASDSISIIDLYAKLGNEFSASSSGIGEGIRNSASTLAMTGNSIEQTAALLAGNTDMSQNTGELGNVLKIAALRLAAMKEPLSEIGAEYKDIESVSKNQAKIYSLTNGHVNILNAQNGALKDTYTILKEVAESWNYVNDSQKDDLLTLMFGKGNTDQGASVLRSFQSGQVQQAYQSTKTSEGAAGQEQAQFLDSMESKIQQFQTQFQELSTTVMDSDFFKGAIDTGTAFLDVITEIIDKTGVLPSLLGALGGVSFFKNLDEPEKHRVSA
ncbi:MAG: phage tail tape measure protein [Hespellia sp.]|nr:phage tail tape measure protein [Hespellia sp.]